MELISGLSFYKISDFSFCNRYKIKNKLIIEENDKIFLNLDYFEKFLYQINKISPKNKFILITHNSDRLFTQYHFNKIKKYVNKIYAINNVCNEPNVYTIPIGFRDYPVLTSTILQKIKYENEIISKTILLYMNFSINTNYKKRIVCYNNFINKNWVTTESNKKIEEFYLQLAKSKYALSPEGTGIDCHRIYEAFYFDTIPILKTSGMNIFYNKLPVIIVNEWNEINEKDLNIRYTFYLNKLQSWKEKNIGWEFPDYWLYLY